MEAHAMKLLVHSFCADVNTRGGLETLQLLSQQSDFYMLQCAVTPLCNLMVELLWFLNTSTL